MDSTKVLRRWTPILISIWTLSVAGSLSAFNMGYHYEMIREVARKQGLNRDAYCVMLAGNSYVDLFQESSVEYIIDDDFCEVSKKLVECLHFDNLYDAQAIDRYWRLLIKNTYDSIARAVRRNDPLSVLLVTGVTLHMVQDFYAHANWVELDVARLVQKRDATYFDVVNNPLAQTIVLGGAIELDSRMPFRRYDHDVGLFTHGSHSTVTCPVNNQQFVNETIYAVPRPIHAELNKDYPSKAYFPWALRCGYKASLQWLMLIEKWVSQDLNRPDFWNILKNYNYPGNKNNLYRLTSFDDGTIRWIFTYGGAWKCNRRWSTADILADNLPNVPGIGVTEQNNPDYPYLGIEWFENCFQVAKGLFESRRVDNATNTHIVRRLSDRIDNLDRAKRDKNNFGEIVKIYQEEVPFAGVPNLTDDANPVVKNAIAYMATCLGNTWNDVKWLRVQIPKVEDIDTGGGLFNVNNEEVGGTSDYWPMIIINGVEYSEAEYVDQSAPYTVWGVIKPLWTIDTVRFHIKLYESDPWDHKAIKMRIAPEQQGVKPDFKYDLHFTFDPAGAGSVVGLHNQCEWYTTPIGFFIKSQGTDYDWSARVFVHLGLMSDKRVEFVVQTAAGENSGTNDSAWADVGPYMWLLDHPDYDDLRPIRLKTGFQIHTSGSRRWCTETFTWARHTDLYAFDPGPSWTKEKLYRLAVHKNNDRNDPWRLTRLHARSVDLVKGDETGGSGTTLNSDNSTWTPARNPNLPRVASADILLASLDPSIAPVQPSLTQQNQVQVDRRKPTEGLIAEEPDPTERPTIPDGIQLSTAQHTIPIERLPQGNLEAPRLSIVEALRKQAWYFAVATRTANLNNAQTDDKVYISFLDQNRTVLVRYLLDNFGRREFRRGNKDFFWLELQYNRPGITYAAPRFEYDRIKYIKLEKPGKDEWCLAHIEVWVNDLLLYESAPSVWLNDNNQSTEIRVR